MKRIISIVICMCLKFAVSGCGGQKVTSEDLQGFWYDEESEMVMGFKQDQYILYGFGTQISITGTFEIDSKTLTVHTNSFGDKIYESVNVKNNILSLTTEDNSTTQWKKVSEDEVERMMLEDR